jgi:hypothetical protein
MTIRMASVEVLDYRKDGEVEGRRMAMAEYHGEMADFPEMMLDPSRC